MSREKVLQIRGQEFVMFLRFTFLGLSTLENFKITLEQIIQTVKGQNNYGNRIFFQLFLSFHVEKWEKKFPTRKNIFPRRKFFFPTVKNIFSNFSKCNTSNGQ